MSQSIYLELNRELVEMQEQSYDSEDVLQALLEQYPNLLAGAQMDEAVPRKWLFIGREIPVPTDQWSSGGLSLDHLFIDQDAIPTLVEVKRGTDTRIRREVVGQMLDYAANAVAYWPIEKLRSLFEAQCQAAGRDPGLELPKFLEDESAPEAFWQTVKSNLQAGRIRMVFVADEVPSELRRIVEFLNSQLERAEVFAVEVKRFVGQGHAVFVPHLIGQTVEAEMKKRPIPKQWDEESFPEELARRRPAAEVDVARSILDWARQKVTRVEFGRGQRSGSFVPIQKEGLIDHLLFAVWTYGTVEIYFAYYLYKEIWKPEEKRFELRRKLNQIPSVAISADAITKRPGIPLAVLAHPVALDEFLRVFEWFLEESKPK